MLEGTNSNWLTCNVNRLDNTRTRDHDGWQFHYRLTMNSHTGTFSSNFNRLRISLSWQSTRVFNSWYSQPVWTLAESSLWELRNSLSRSTLSWKLSYSFNRKPSFSVSVPVESTVLFTWHNLLVINVVTSYFALYCIECQEFNKLSIFWRERRVCTTRPWNATKYERSLYLSDWLHDFIDVVWKLIYSILL